MRIGDKVQVVNLRCEGWGKLNGIIGFVGTTKQSTSVGDEWFLLSPDMIGRNLTANNLKIIPYIPMQLQFNDAGLPRIIRLNSYNLGLPSREFMAYKASDPIFNTKILTLTLIEL